MKLHLKTLMILDQEAIQVNLLYNLNCSSNNNNHNKQIILLI